MESRNIITRNSSGKSEVILTELEIESSKVFKSSFGGQYQTYLLSDFKKLPNLSDQTVKPTDVADILTDKKSNCYIIAAIYDLTDKTDNNNLPLLFSAGDMTKESIDDDKFYFNKDDYGGYLTILCQLVIANYVSPIKISHISSLLKSFRVTTEISSALFTATRVVHSVGFKFEEVKLFLNFDKDNLLVEGRHRDWMRYRTTMSGSANIIIKVADSLGSGFEFMFGTDINTARKFKPFDPAPYFSIDTLAFCYHFLTKTTGELSLWYQGKKAFENIAPSRITVWNSFHTTYSRIMSKLDEVEQAKTMEQLVMSMKKIYTKTNNKSKENNSKGNSTLVPTKKDRPKSLFPTQSPQPKVRFQQGSLQGSLEDLVLTVEQRKYRDKARNELADDKVLMRYMDVCPTTMASFYDFQGYAANRDEYMKNMEIFIRQKEGVNDIPEFNDETYGYIRI
jgi:hypothetical protein